MKIYITKKGKLGGPSEILGAFLSRESALATKPKDYWDQDDLNGEQGGWGEHGGWGWFESNNSYWTIIECKLEDQMSFFF